MTKAIAIVDEHGEPPHQKMAERAKTRASLMAAVRHFFTLQEFIEVDTPVLVATNAPEAHIEAIAVTAHNALGQKRPLYLQTSPELAMKRLVAAGLERIFQVAPVFRDGDVSPTHRPEFRMLEWYRAHSTVGDLMDDCEALLAACAAAIAPPNASAHLWAAPFPRISMQEAFGRYAGFDLLEALELRRLRQALTRAAIFFDDNDTWDELFGRVFVGKVEPGLVAQAAGAPFFLTEFPQPLAALSRLDSRDPRVAERFELYVGSLELANGFGELNDTQQQRQRFVAENQARVAAGRLAYPLDERFLAELGGLPKTAGIALGLDRLLMALTPAADLDRVCALPYAT